MFPFKNVKPLKKCHYSSLSYYSLMVKHAMDTTDKFSKIFLMMRSIQDLIPKLQKRFCGITITSVNKRQRWGIINYTKENHRQHIIILKST